MEKSELNFIREGNEIAFSDFYRKYYQSFFSYSLRLTGDRELIKDCIQELFFELWKSRLSVNTDVKDARSYMLTWLRRIIGRRLKIILVRVTTEKETNHLLSIPSYEDLLILQQSNEEKSVMLQTALNSLTPKQLIIIKSRFFENKPFVQICQENSMAIQTVYNTIYKSLVVLKKNMSFLKTGRNNHNQPLYI